MRAQNIQEVAPDLYRVQIPLPNSPLKYLNSYFILGSPRNLVVDTGLNRDECHQAFMQGVEELGLDLERTDFLITHLHADHFALIQRVAAPGSRVFFNQPDTEVLENVSDLRIIFDYGGLNGFPPDKLDEAMHGHPGYKFGYDKTPSMTLLDDGDTLSAGPYHFTCLQTPGHTPGHTCLWEPEHGLLLAGDHILDEITPNLQCWRDDYNPLQNYLDSLKRVSRLPVKLALPGHRRLIEDCKGRIAQIMQHHQERLAEIMATLEQGAQHAYQIATRITWDLKCDGWDDISLAHQWFAVGEVIAHLRYLEVKGQVQSSQTEGVTIYHLAERAAS